MNRVALFIPTGELITFQGGGKVDRITEAQLVKCSPGKTFEQYNKECDDLEETRLDIVRQEALSYCYTPEQIWVGWKTDNELAMLIEAKKRADAERRP